MLPAVVLIPAIRTECRQSQLSDKKSIIDQTGKLSSNEWIHVVRPGYQSVANSHAKVILEQRQKGQKSIFFVTPLPGKFLISPELPSARVCGYYTIATVVFHRCAFGGFVCNLVLLPNCGSYPKLAKIGVNWHFHARPA